jgi:hypothetical protein
VSPVRYELSFYIPEDGILHNRRRDNLKSYMDLFSSSLEGKETPALLGPLERASITGQPLSYKLQLYNHLIPTYHGSTFVHSSSQFLLQMFLSVPFDLAWPLNTLGKELPVPIGWGGGATPSRDDVEKRTCYPCRESNLDSRAHSSALYRLRYRGFYKWKMKAAG